MIEIPLPPSVKKLLTILLIAYLLGGADIGVVRLIWMTTCVVVCFNDWMGRQIWWVCLLLGVIKVVTSGFLPEARDWALLQAGFILLIGVVLGWQQKAVDDNTQDDKPAPETT